MIAAHRARLQRASGLPLAAYPPSSCRTGLG
jgi:hypothetical protein